MALFVSFVKWCAFQIAMQYEWIGFNFSINSKHCVMRNAKSKLNAANWFEISYFCGIQSVFFARSTLYQFIVCSIHWILLHKNEHCFSTQKKYLRLIIIDIKRRQFFHIIVIWICVINECAMIWAEEQQIPDLINLFHWLAKKPQKSHTDATLFNRFTMHCEHNFALISKASLCMRYFIHSYRWKQWKPLKH